jgi:hypothetical protein
VIKKFQLIIGSLKNKIKKLKKINLNFKKKFSSPTNLNIEINNEFINKNKFNFKEFGGLIEISFNKDSIISIKHEPNFENSNWDNLIEKYSELNISEIIFKILHYHCYKRLNFLYDFILSKKELGIPKKDLKFIKKPEISFLIFLIFFIF